jgi:hypothetical protein
MRSSNSYCSSADKLSIVGLRILSGKTLVRSFEYVIMADLIDMKHTHPSEVTKSVSTPFWDKHQTNPMACVRGM